MSRRKQSNPKSIKVSPDSPEAEGADKDAGDVRSQETSDQHLTTREADLGDSPPHHSADSPDHIDVVSTCHSPLVSPSPAPLTSTASRSPPPSSRGSPQVVVKVEKEECQEGRNSRKEEEGGHHHGNGIASLGAGAPPPVESSASQGLVKHLQLPSDVLYLKEMEVMVHGTPTPSWMICSAIPLPKGSSLGPFCGNMVSSDNIRVGNLILEFHSKTGHVVLVNVAGQSGAWLALLRPAVSELTRNALVYLEGGRIWCEIVSDVEIGMELRATFVFDLDDLSLADRELSLAPSPQNPPDRAPPAASSPPAPPAQLPESSPLLQQPSAGHAALIYGCPFCSVRFSSPRTLQGHLSYYCSKKKAENIISPRPRSRRGSDCQGSSSLPPDMVRIKQEVDTDASKDAHTSPQPDVTTATGSSGTKRPAPLSDSNNSSGGDLSPPPAKAACLDSPSTFQCPLCSYCADKPASLNRHMRIHNRQPEPGVKVKPGGEGKGAGAPGPTAAPPNSATYCKECNIQFSSLSTFQCHKMHYCSQRNMGRAAALERKQESPQFDMSGVPTLGLAGNMSVASLQLATLGQNGLLFPQGAGLTGEGGVLPAGATLMPGGQPAVIVAAPVMTPSGVTNMAIPLSTVLQSIHVAAAAAAVSTSVSPASVSVSSPQKSSPKPVDASPRSGPEEAHQSKSPKRSYSSSDAENSVKELPLDLSTKKSDTEESGSPEKQIKREKEEARSPVSAAPSAAGSSPGAGRSSSAEDASLPGGSGTPRVPSVPTSVAGLPPHLLASSLLPPFLPLHNMALPVKPPPHMFAGIPPGSNKCTDCNIIFYKHENYLIHKQHYCSGKKLRPPPAASSSVSARSSVETGAIKAEPSATVTSTSEPGTSQSPRSATSPGKDAEPSPGVPPHYLPSAIKPPVPSQAAEDIYYKFFCVPCKIKFSSASNLKAHKEYYCPHGKNSEHSIIAQRPSGEIISTGGGSSDHQSPGSNGSSPSPGQYCCTQCRSTFTSSRLLKLHLCSAEVAQASLLKCSHCDYVTHTEKRLAEHMKVHNPTSAYRCTLCGYRGNTVRGMRMHGKTHTDNGEDFNDGHMIEFQEPPLVPIQTNSDVRGVQGPFSVEAELLRLKNEPYKRRRSRKAYEKVDILVPLDDPQSCHLCGECFADPRSLVAHLRIHEMSTRYMQEVMRCNQCDFVSKSPEEMSAHMEISHGLIPREEKENHPQSASPGKKSPLEKNSFERESSTEKKSPVRIKEEPLDSDTENRETQQSDVTAVEESADDRDQSLDRTTDETQNESKYEEIDVENNSSPTQSVHIKTEAELDRDDDSYNDPPLPITFATPPSAPSQPPPSSDSPASRPPSHSPTPNHHSPPPPASPPSIVSVKVEPDLTPPPLPASPPPPPRPIFPRFFVAAQDRNGRQGSRSGENSVPVPYCKNCDISFTYHSTFIAHKKYYCTERAGLPSSATA
ncbi:uncharacterized protein LOC143286042 isoform X2 [Babylonia areolata]|uniref:uncharacterized protein LOC143286042 isoform X2 n=1 Tax=Babylonia areolata TaxID=304850 RepID=UPI003FD4BD37